MIRLRTGPLAHLFASASVLASVVVACRSDPARPSVPPAASLPGANALPPLESRPPGLVPDASQASASSSPVVYDVGRGVLFIAGGEAGTVAEVDPDKGTLVAEIGVGRDVRAVALSPDGAWLAAIDRGGGTLSLIDPQRAKVVRVLAVGSHPRAVVWDAVDPRWAYVAVEDDDALLTIDRTLGVVADRVAVGRLPSGVAVPAHRREVYVTHRIDGQVTVVDPTLPAVAADIALADEPSASDPTVPHGRPFAFESLVISNDGATGWLPHELLAKTHPFELRSTLFPSVSVVDVSPGKRVEIASDPTVAAIAGRKNLFDAINVLDATGTPEVVSQPCAAAFHPGGYVAYVLACASEDLLVFDALSGRAIEILRNLPGDHPVGLALDATGARAFVVSDQSLTVTTLALGGGTPLDHVKVVGAPLSFATHDLTAPELREGEKLFFRANSSKGELATTGDDWMSCGGCHLDGFGSSNRVFFDVARGISPATLRPSEADGGMESGADATVDASMGPPDAGSLDAGGPPDAGPPDAGGASVDPLFGHSGLARNFATTVPVDPPTFEPHDVIVTLLEQGGLAPDRTGRVRGGAVDPAAPSSAATQLAASIARVVARDMPAAPSWLLPKGDPKNAAPDRDGAFCGGCHAAEYAAWRQSAHAHASEDAVVRFGANVEATVRGPRYRKLCAGCHDPVSARLGDTSMSGSRGVSCLGCHDVSRAIRAGGNADLEATSQDWTQDHVAAARAEDALLATGAFCGGCHQQFVPGTGFEAIATYREWSESPAARSGSSCVDCHMPTGAGGTVDHAAVGGNVYFAHARGGGDAEARARDRLRSAMTMRAAHVGDRVEVTLENHAGHAYPTGVADVREVWIELQAMDATNAVLARFGGPTPDGTLDPAATRLGLSIDDNDGKELVLHELSETVTVARDVRVPPQGSRMLSMGWPATLPLGTDHVDAVLFDRHVRTAMLRAMTGDPKAIVPEVEVARATLR